MENIYLSKVARKAIEKAMPTNLRKWYKNGNAVVDVTIVRRIPLMRYGRRIHLQIERNGKYVVSDKEDLETRKHIAENVVEYFVTGDKGTPRVWDTHGWTCGKFGPIHSQYVTDGDFAIFFE